MDKIDWTKDIEAMGGEPCSWKARGMGGVCGGQVINSVHISPPNGLLVTVFDDGISTTSTTGNPMIRNVAEKPEPEYLTLPKVLATLGEGLKINTKSLRVEYLTLAGGTLITDLGTPLSLEILRKHKFTLYTEPKPWYEDIPNGGIMCKNGNDYLLIVNLIHHTDRELYLRDSNGDDNMLLDTIPLTPEEIQVFADNAK